MQNLRKLTKLNFEQIIRTAQDREKSAQKQEELQIKREFFRHVSTFGCWT